MTASEIDLLESVLDQTEATIAGVQPDQVHRPTPCPDFDVSRLVDHLVGWATSFAARVTGGSFEGDPDDFRSGPDPAAQFQQAARSIVRAYRDGSDGSGQLPLGMLLMEYATHGWDLATATGQPFAIAPAAADAALDAGRRMLKPEYRGPDKTFGYEVEVAASVSSLDRLVAFLGRDPDWQAAPA